MRALWLLVLLAGCTYDTNYYGDPTDGGAEADGEPMIEDIWHPDSKLQGSANLVLDQLPVELLAARVKGNRPQMMSVMLSRYGDPIAFNIGNPDAEIVARFVIGIGGGAQATFDVDWIEGSVLSFPANFITVQAYFRQFPPGGAGPAWWNTINPGVQATVSPGVIAHGRTPQRTIGNDNSLAPGPAVWQQWDVPAFAKNVTFVVNPVNAQLYIEMRGINGLVYAGYNIVGFVPDSLPIPNGTRYIRVYNAAALGNISIIRMIFDLAL